MGVKFKIIKYMYMYYIKCMKKIYLLMYVLKKYVENVCNYNVCLN